jgi:hypothetical protein
MGQAKRRGTKEKRIAQAIAEGRDKDKIHATNKRRITRDTFTFGDGLLLAMMAGVGKRRNRGLKA